MSTGAGLATLLVSPGAGLTSTGAAPGPGARLQLTSLLPPSSPLPAPAPVQAVDSARAPAALRPTSYTARTCAWTEVVHETEGRRHNRETPVKEGNNRKN